MPASGRGRFPVRVLVPRPPGDDLVGHLELTPASSPTTGPPHTDMPSSHVLYICWMRVDADLVGSAVAGAAAAGAAIGTWHLQPPLAILLGLVFIAACGVVWRRHHSFHEPLRSPHDEH